MVEIEQTPWLDLSTWSDKQTGRRRFVKTLGVSEGFGRAAKFEVVVSGEAGKPPEDMLTEAFKDWFAHD
jgi:hypothetical protein